MNIYLRHPRHGEKIATLEMEAVYDEGNGWVRFDPNDSAPAVNTLAVPQRRARRVAALIEE